MILCAKQSNLTNNLRHTYHCIESQTSSVLVGVFQPDERRPLKKKYYRYYWDRFKSPNKTLFMLLSGLVVKMFYYLDDCPHPSEFFSFCIEADC